MAQQQRFGFLIRAKENKKFSYGPLYFNKEKWEREKRLKDIANTSGTDEETLDRQMKFSDSLFDSVESKRYYRKLAHQRNMSRMRFVIILNILLILVLIILYKFM